MPLLDVRLNGFAVVAAEGPKLDQNDLASEVCWLERFGIEPLRIRNLRHRMANSSVDLKGGGNDK
jgi:hypothetical protein